jgi:dynamin 1-like protein
VIESIVGRDFLPRGSGIVTRCPLKIILRRIDYKDIMMAGEEWGVFNHREGELFFNFDDIR